MKISTVFALSVAILSSATVMRASVPIIVSGGAGRRVMANLCNKAEKEIKAGNFAGAKRDVDAISAAPCVISTAQANSFVTCSTL